MLERSPITAAASRQAAGVVKARNLPKLKSCQTPRQRAAMAARWLTGGVVITPSLKLAATALGVSQPLIIEAIKSIESPVVSPVDALWAAMGDGERAAFVARHQVTIWGALDRATA